MKNLNLLLFCAICLSLIVSCNSSNEEKSSTELLDKTKTTQVKNEEKEIIIEEEDVKVEAESEVVPEEVEVAKTEEKQVKAEVIQDKPTSVSEQQKRLVGTWVFTKATAGGSDRSSEYIWGYVDGENKKMTLLADGTIQYEKAIIDALKIEKATWKIEKHQTKDFYYFVTERIAGGVTQTSKEKIISSTAKKFVFGKRFAIEYVASSL